MRALLCFIGSALEVAMAHRDRALPPLPASVPAEVTALVMQLTAKSPAARPRSAGEAARRAAELAGAQFVGGSAQPGHTAYGEAPAAAERPTVHLGRAAPRRGGRRRGHRVASAAVAAIAAIVAVTALVTSSVTGPDHVDRLAALPSSSPSGPQLPGGVVTVKVARSSLLGQPVASAVRMLRHRGLAVRVLCRHSDTQPPGRVISILPVGHRPVGSLVTVTGALQPLSSGAPSHGDGTPHHPGHGRGPPKTRSDGPKHGRPGGPARTAPHKAPSHGHGAPKTHGNRHHKAGGKNGSATYAD